MFAENMPTIIFGTDGNLPSIILSFTNDQIELLSFLHDDRVLTLINWFRGILGAIILGLTLIKLIVQIPKIFDGKFTWFADVLGGHSGYFNDSGEYDPPEIYN